MATTIGTFTINGTDAGNLPSYNDMYIYEATNLFAVSGTSSLTPGSITDVLDQYVTYVISLGGTMTYSLSMCYRDWETDRKSTRLNSSH